MSDTPEPALNELTVLKGGIDLTVDKIDGSKEQVKVRQLPIRFVPEFGNLQGDEASLVELLCDKADRHVIWHVRNARASEMRLLEILRQAPFEQIGEIEKKLHAVRAEIEAHEDKGRWSDSLTDDSIVKIRDLGEQLNRPRFGRWAKRTRTSTGRMMKEQSASVSESSPPPSQSSSGSEIPAT